LVGSGACAMMIGKPNMCNGANIAYPKAVFEEVNGFDGNEHIASGDDEFLMHKIAEKYPNQIVFAHYQPNIVYPITGKPSFICPTTQTMGKQMESL
jgi:hypothetical protein